MGRTGVWRFAQNVMSLLGAGAIDRITNFIVLIAVGRYLGSRSLGQLVLAVSLFQLFLRFTGLGLRDLITREVARDRKVTAQYLGNAAGLVWVAAGIGSALIVGLVALLNYAPDTRRIILLLFVGLFPYALRQVAEAVFIAWERTRYVVAVNTPVHVAQTAVAVWMAATGRSLAAIVLSIVCAYAAMAVLLLIAAARMAGLSGAKFDPAFARSLLGAATPFFGMQGAVAITASINVVALSKFVGEAGVGVFGAATQLLVPLGLATESTASVLFPVMVRRARGGIDSLRRVAQQATELTIAIVFPAVVLVVAFGGSLLQLVYGGAEFEESVRALQVLAWAALGEA